MSKLTWEQKLNTQDKKQVEIRERFQKAADNKQQLIEKYVRGLTPNISDEMRNLRQFAQKNSIPIIQPETEKFLLQIIALKKPKKVLEIGTAIGYSSLVIAHAMNSGKIDTIEKSEKMVRLANQNITIAPKDVFINIILGNGIEEIQKLSIFSDNLSGCKYDLIFIDAAKGQYMSFLDAALPVLNRGGIIISDNIFYGGLVARDRYDVPRRQRTIHKRMRKYLYRLMNSPEFDTSLLNVGDGIAMSFYKL